MVIQQTQINVKQKNNSLIDNNDACLGQRKSNSIQSQAIYSRLPTKRRISIKPNETVIRFPGNLELTIELDVGVLSRSTFSVSNSSCLT